MNAPASNEQSDDDRRGPASTGLRYGATAAVFLLLALLVGQFILTQTHPEPYPSFLFPGFASVPSTDSTYEVRDVRIEVKGARGDRHKIRYHRLFASVPRVHAYLLTNRLFSGRTPLYLPPDSVRARSPSSPTDRSLWLPRWHDGRTVPELRDQLRTYVRQRLDVMKVPISDPVSMHVEWRTRTHRIGGTGTGAETERVLSSYTLPLAP